MSSAAWSPLFSLAVVILAIASCTAGGTDPAGRIEVRDSAGVTLVTLPPFETGAYGALRLDSVAELEVGDGAGGSPLLERVASARLLDGGGLAVLDAGAATVRRYGPDGLYLGSTGQPGDGPGEFRGPVFLQPWGPDSLAIWDGPSDRLHLLDLHATWRSASIHPELAVATVYGRAGMDSIFITRLVRPPAPPGNGLHSFGITALVASPAGEDTLFEMEGPRWFFQWEGTGNLQIMPVPFEAEPAVVPFGNRLVLATGRLPELVVYDGSRGLIARLTIPDLRRPVDAEEFDLAVEEAVDLEREPARETARELFGLMPVPDRHPAYGVVLGGHDGTLWVQDPPDPREAAIGWTVIGPGWNQAARVALPRAWKLHDVGRDRVVAEYDDVDEPRVGVFRLRGAP